MHYISRQWGWEEEEEEEEVRIKVMRTRVSLKAGAEDNLQYSMPTYN